MFPTPRVVPAGPHIDPPLPRLVARYADRLHRTVEGEHWIASPLGAWLLLAVATPAAEPGSCVAEQMAEALGAPIPEAVRLAGELLGSPHLAVHAETAAWADLDVTTAGIVEWAGALPAGTTFDTRIPTPGEADEWARRATDGQITRFPVDVEEALVVLASALSLDVSWPTPLGTEPASALGHGAPLASRVQRVLRAARDGDRAVVRTDLAGDVALVVHRATTDVLVATVAAAPHVPAADVLAAAHDLATGAAFGRRSGVDPFDLPLGEGPVITVTERQAPVRGMRESVVHAYLPAWTADSTHDLMPAPGIAAGAAALIDLLPPDEGPFEATAQQVATAEFTGRGFRAAAVSVMAIVPATGAPVVRPGRLREVTLTFGHPHAVVAVALDQARGPWHGVPVFSAWVGKATEVPDEQ